MSVQYKFFGSDDRGRGVEMSLAELQATVADGAVAKASWTALSTVTGSRNGQPANVPDADAGTHTDPVSGLTVANAGRYSWSVSPAGWQWMESNAASADDVEVLDARVEAIETVNAGPRINALETMFETWSSLGTLDLATAGDALTFSGYSSVRDCPEILVKAISEPVDTPKFWERQSADGRWWSYAMDVYYASQFGATKGSDAFNDAAELQAAIDCAANKTLWMDGISYVTGGENLIISNPISIRWDTHRSFNNRIIYKGTGATAVRTTRKHPDDGADAAISCGFVFATAGITLDNPFVDLWYDSGDEDPGNLGSNYGVAYMGQSVNNVVLNNPRARGYWRDYGLLIDCTAANANADRWRITGGELYGKVSLGLTGPLLKIGTTQIDIADTRGKGGLGDCSIDDVALRGYSHHSGHRISDTEGGCLFMEGYLYGSAPQESFQGVVLNQTRFQSPDPKTVNIAQYRQVTFRDCMVDRPTGFVKTDGVTEVTDNDCVISHGAGAKQIKWRDCRIQRSLLSVTSGAIVEMSGCTDHLGKAIKLPWTPALASVAITYTARGGGYTRIGDEVEAEGYITVSSLDIVDDSRFTIGGLPYAIKPNTPVYVEIDYLNSTLVSFGASDVVIGLRVATSDTQVSLGKPDKTGWAYNSGRAVASGTIHFRLRYKAVDET